MRTLLKDIRYGLRVLWKTKGFTAVVVLTLALGIGVNVAIFSGVSAFVLRPLPGTGEPERLVALFETMRGGSGTNDFSYPDYLDYSKQSDVFDGIIAHNLAQAALGEGEQSEVVYGQMVTGNFFDALKVKMERGRGFLPEEDATPGTHAVVVLAYDLWRNRFGADERIVGKSIQLNGHPFTVVGVASREFMGAEWALGMSFWTPMMMKQQVAGGTDGWITSRGNHWLEVLARLKQGVTAEQAGAQLTAVASRLEREYPDARNKDVIVKVVPEPEGRWGDLGGIVQLSSGLAMVVVGLILLIACANVANLMLARSVVRRREIGIRLALGAGRWRVVRQLLTESVLLSLAGGGLGLILAFWMTDAMRGFFPSIAYKIVLDIAPDRRALLFTLAVSILTGIVFGLAPALQASKPDLVPVLKGESQRAMKAHRFSLRNILVVSQVALSLVVLVCAALFLQSFRNAKLIDPGFETRDAVAVSINPGLFGYSKEQGRDFYARLAERTRNVPGVKAAGFVNWMPLGSDSSSWGQVYPSDQPPPEQGEGVNVFAEIVSAGYFDAMRIPLLQGRDFNERDRAGILPEAAVINETLAHRFWPNESAIGKRLLVGRTNPDALEVVGVVKDSKIRTLGESRQLALYVTVDQTYNNGMTLIVRSTGDLGAVVAGVRQAVKELDARMPLYNVKTMEQHLTWAFWAHNMAASLSTAFGLLALLLAATGLYGVITYTVAQRTREIGIRIALGAQARDVLRLVLGQGMALTLIGLALGLAAALALARLMLSLLYGVNPANPTVYILVAVALAAVALLACLVPARRATRVDPMVALRYE